MAMIWLVLSLIVFIYFLQQLLGPRNKKKLPPGPKGLPILGHLHLMGKNPHRDLHRLARKHGPIMGLRLGFVPALVVSSPAAAELVLKTHDLVFASRPANEAAACILYDKRDLAFGPYGPYWRHMRKLLTLKLLSNVKIGHFQPMRRAEVGLFVASLRRAAERREAVDLRAQVTALNCDINFLMVFGKRYSTMEDKGFEEAIKEAMVILGKFNLADYFPYIGVLNLQGLHGKMKRVSNIIDGILEKIIDDHMKMKRHEEHTADIVDTLMEIMESGEAGFEFDLRHVKAILLDMVVAGMDTSSTALEWAMSELMKHPAVMKKLQEELESVVGLDQMVEESHLEKLQYLECVVKEAMRLHHVGPLLIPHESMEDCEVGGFHVPKKARVIVNVWAIGRDPGVWADPDSFAPERFIGSQIDLRGHHFELLPFGAGRRGCPGLQLGLTVVKLVLAQLVHCFDWKLPDGMKESDVDMTEKFGLVNVRLKPLMAVPTYRLHKH
ncbi:cytochrome P450 71AU50-like [Salvia splendens]|uniref:cytochrome P450 71AU50-like n=1 Tax=Salvia splendens TaxID=180675 RepID=UPI001C27B92E|nr:cytochrome P450 71AU50-like [Salvia splendens]